VKIRVTNEYFVVHKYIIFLSKILTTPMISHNQNLSLYSLVILPPIYQHFLKIITKVAKSFIN